MLRFLIPPAAMFAITVSIIAIAIRLLQMSAMQAMSHAYSAPRSDYLGPVVSPQVHPKPIHEALDEASKELAILSEVCGMLRGRLGCALTPIAPMALAAQSNPPCGLPQSDLTAQIRSQASGIKDVRERIQRILDDLEL